MPIYAGSSAIGGVYHGSQAIKEVYYGADLVWQNVPRTRMDYGWEDARTSPYRIMFMGSSTTAGYVVLHTEQFVPQMTAHITSHLLGVNATTMVSQNSGTLTGPTDNGFHFLNAGVGGTNSSTYWGNNRKNLVASYQPRLVIHMIGSNDYSQGMAPSTYKANVQRTISEINNRSSECRHLLIHSFKRLDVTNPTHPWEDYGRMLKEIADERTDTDFCDVMRVIGDRWTEGYKLLSDKIHADWDGNTHLAKGVAEYLNLDTHDGEKIYSLSLLNSGHLSDGTRLGSWGPSEDSLIQEPVIAMGNARPEIRNRNGVVSADFYNGAKKMSADWGGAYAAPLTVFFVARMWNDNFGTSMKPLFTRRTGSDDGYMWVWRDTNSNKVKAAMGSGVSPGVTVSRSVIDSPTITAVTFHPNGWTTLYINATYGTDIPPQSPHPAVGPWMKSLKLMTNTGESSWGEADMYGIYFYKGMGPALVGRKMHELGELHNIPVRDQPGQ